MTHRKKHWLLALSFSAGLALVTLFISISSATGVNVSIQQRQEPTPSFGSSSSTHTPSPAVTATLTPTPASTAAITPTESTTVPTLTAVPTITSTVEILSPSPEITGTRWVYLPMARNTGNLYFPLLIKTTPLPPLELSSQFICSSGGTAFIPDNDPAGASQVISFSDELYVAGVDIYIDVNHDFVGDLSARLVHLDTGKQVELFNRPGYSGSGFGCSQDNIRAIFDDQASLAAENKCGGPAPAWGVDIPAIGGTFLPVEPLSALYEEPLQGDWALTIVDESAGNTGYLGEFCMEMTLSNIPYTPPPPPEVPALPSSAHIGGMWGEDQHLPLDCESRSAVDWARHWGYNIGEFEFFYGLPLTLNPDTGFVGSVYGEWGQIPPDPYGVHAAPIAGRLQHYGLTATAVRSFSWDELRAEIAAGRPVEVWVIGPVASGWPVYYQPAGEPVTVVAPYEHSVIVTGYDSSRVWVLNGDTEYTYSIQQFLDSWGVLRNMAVIGRELSR